MHYLGRLILAPIGMIFVIMKKILHWRTSLSWVLLLLFFNFVTGNRLELLYISGNRLELLYISGNRLELLYISVMENFKAHWSLWLSVGCAFALALKNYFFCFYQQDKSSISRINIRQAIYCCKRLLQGATLAFANKSRWSTTSQKLGFRNFCPITNVVFKKGKFYHSFLFLLFFLFLLRDTADWDRKCLIDLNARKT